MLKEIKTGQFEEIYTIMEQAFPKDERRSKEKQRALLENEDYVIYGYFEEEMLKAFFAVWKQKDFWYLEHFAVAEQFRGQGIGTKALEELKKENDGHIILEVELPENELAKRRIGFYERNEFYLTEYGYEQPPFEEGKSGVLYRLMSYPKQLDETSYERFHQWIFVNLYAKNAIFDENRRKKCC